MSETYEPYEDGEDYEEDLWDDDEDVEEDEEDEGEKGQRSGEELFTEDTGTCPLPVRHAIAALIRRRYISADEDKVAWEGLMSAPDLVRSRLCDALLLLKIDRRCGVAFAKQVELEDDTVPYKVKSVNYFNNVQSLLMVSLVTKYFAQTAAGEARVWIEGDEMRETMRRLFEDDPDIITSENTMRAAIGAMVRNGYLREVAQDRYEVMPIVGVVYTLDEIRAVLERYGLEEVDSDLAKRREGDNRE